MKEYYRKEYDAHDYRFDPHNEEKQTELNCPICKRLMVGPRWWTRWYAGLDSPSSYFGYKCICGHEEEKEK